MRVYALDVLILIYSFVFVACNGGSTAPTSTTTSTSVLVNTVIAEGTFQVEDRATALANGRPCNLAAFIPFATTAAGSIDVIVNWTFSTNDINVEIARGNRLDSQRAGYILGLMVGTFSQ